MLGLDMVSLFTGSIVGLVKSYIDNGAKLKSEQQQLLAKDKLQNRESTNRFYQWTRRVIALSMIFSLILYPIISVLLNIPFYMPYIETNGFIFSFFSGDTMVKFKEVHGLVMPPVLIPATLYILGFYFSSPTKRT